MREPFVITVEFCNSACYRSNNIGTYVIEGTDIIDALKTFNKDIKRLTTVKSIKVTRIDGTILLVPLTERGEIEYGIPTVCKR